MWWLALIIVLAIAGFILFSPWLKGYRTQIAGYLTAAFGAVVPALTEIMGYLQGLDWRQYVLSSDRKNLIVLAIVGGLGVLMIILRRLTTGPTGTKD